MGSAARLLPSGDLEVAARADASLGFEDQLASTFAALRVLSARENVSRLGRDQGYRLEDVTHLAAYGLDEAACARTTAWLARRLPPDTRITCELGEGPLGLRAIIAPRVEETAREYRVGADGRVEVESVELHVVEHCNLRCAQCCNVSPYLPARTISLEEVRRTCERLRAVVRPQVLKIMGGEPLLHPDVGGLLRTIQESGVAPRMRLFTNGLLLRTLDDVAFARLDELTVSSYASAPLKPELVAETEARARRFDVVLNVKEVASFSTVLAEAPRAPADVQATYDACWLRHRCLVVRSGVFYKCTRAAYHADYHERVALEGRDQDAEIAQRTLGIPLDAPDFAARLASYLGSQAVLASCSHCFGSSGPLTEHVQLRKRDVAAGRLAPERSS